MSIIDTLVTDRTQSDITQWRALHDRGWANMTADEKAEWSAGMKGAYNATDLNRVNEALIYLRDLFGGFGFSADIKLPVITDVTPGTIEPGESRLPDGYTELEYIESSGTQYIDTGFKPNQDTRVVVDVYITEQHISSNCVFGTRSAASSTAPLMFNLWSMNAGTAVRFDYFGGNTTSSTSLVGKRSLVDANKNICTIGDTVLNGTYQQGQTKFNLFVLTCNNAGNFNSQYNTYARLYSCQIYDNGTLIRDYVPAKNSGDVIGLYDLVNDTFYQNAGTGVFTAGPEIIPEPIITPPVITTRTNWTIKDIPASQQMDEYLANVEAIRSMMSNIPVYPSGWQTPPDTPETMQYLTYEQANDIERILTDINDLLEWVSNNLVWVFAGDVYAGEW